MSNDYFDAADYVALTRLTLARAEAVNAIFAAVVAGFDVLPSAAYIKENRIGFAVDTGAADAYIVDQNVRPSGYNNGLLVVFVAGNANTGACTINVKGSSASLLGVKSIKRPDGTDPAANDIPAGSVVVLYYYGSTFQILAPISAAALAAQTAAAASAAAALVSQGAASSSASASAASAAAALASQIAAAASAVSAAISAAAAGHIYLGAVTGTGDSMVSSYVLSAYAIGIQFEFIAPGNNTGPSVININTLGSVALKDADGSALPAGAILSGRRYTGTFITTSVARIAEIDVSQSTATTGSDTVGKMSSLRTLQSIQANAILQGLHMLDFEGRALTPRTTNGPVASSSETATNKVMIAGLAYDQTTSQYAQIRFVMPKSWNGGTITCRARWTAASGSGTVIWGFQAVALRDNVPLESAFGTAATVTDTLLTASYEHVSPTSAAITIAGSPVAQDTIILQVYRDIADTLNASAILLSVEVFATINAGNDA